MASSEAQNKGNITCPPSNAVHIIVSRGSLEQQGVGQTGTLAANITQRLPGSTTQGLVYPAVLFPYVDSESEGVGNLTQLLYDFKAACPTSKYVLLGWSQGGQVTLDTLCGTSEATWNVTQPIASQYTENFVAAVVYGDPSFGVGQPYNAGTATRSGIFHRNFTAGCDPYDSRIKSYCDQNDTYCTNYNASGLAIHFGYFNKYNEQAADFVVSNFRQAVSSSSTSPTASPTGAIPSGTSTTVPSMTSGVAAAAPSHTGMAGSPVWTPESGLLMMAATAFSLLASFKWGL